MEIQAPENWHSLYDCLGCKYYLACYQPVRRMCKTAEEYLNKRIREEWQKHYPDVEAENEDWGE